MAEKVFPITQLIFRNQRLSLSRACFRSQNKITMLAAKTAAGAIIVVPVLRQEVDHSSHIRPL